MAEEVNTGGLIRFVRKNEEKIDKETENKIDEAYKRAEIRKAKERRNKIIWVSIAIILLLILGYFFLK